MPDDQWRRYRVWLRSVPGPYEQYDGYVDAAAWDREQAIAKAIDKLRVTSFPDRPPSCWRVERAEVL